MASIAELIPQRIKQARIEAGLTLLQLAKRIHLSGAMSIARYESGQRRVSVEMLEHIAAATGKELNWFFRSSDCENCQEDEIFRNETALKLREASQRLSAAGCIRLLEYAELLHTRYLRCDSVTARTSSIAADTPIEYN